MQLGRAIIFIGILLVVIGGLVMLASRIGLPLGRLPGDISWKGKNTAVYFPLATCLLISIVLSLIFWLIGKFRG